MVRKRHYQQCLDELEGLIVSRMFELTKMNMSQTALWVCSQAICRALDQYNAAASTLSPPCPNLSWNDVVKYTFLADFDLLCDLHQDVRDRPWSQPTFCVMIDHSFKLERAHEEILCLNVEISHVITYIRDKDLFLQSKEAELRVHSPGLVHQVQKHRLEKGHSNKQHMHWFRKLSLVPGFMG
ncbi:hypothetical protein L208DRAFT_1048587, partial [Tricholoma matsutake]